MVLADPSRSDRDERYEIDDVLRQLEELEDAVSSAEERDGIRRTRRMLERVPGSNRIRKYTTRDVTEGTVGAIVFALPLLVEDGVFDIAEWLTGTTVGPVPVFLSLNVTFVVVLVAVLLYATDFRDVVANPIFGVVPRRLVAVLTISFAVAATTMFVWGRLHENDPTRLEAFGRITVIWVAAALGGSIADILPGESSGVDIRDRIAEIGDGDGDRN